MIEKILQSKYWYYAPEYFSLDEELGLYSMCENINYFVSNLNGLFSYPDEVLCELPSFGYLLFVDGVDLVLLKDGSTAEVFQSSWFDVESIEEDLGVTVSEMCVVGETNRHTGPYGTVYLCKEWTGDFGTEVVRIPIDKLNEAEIGECLTNIVCDPLATCWMNILFHVLGELPPLEV